MYSPGLTETAGFGTHLSRAQERQIRSMNQSRNSRNNTAPRVLVVTKPLVPPWRDGTKVLVRDLVGAARHTRFVVPVPKGHAAPWDHVETWAPFGATNGTGLRSRVELFAHLLRSPEADLVHFFFSPNPASSAVGRLVTTYRKRPTIQTVCSIPKTTKGLRWLVFSDHLVVLSRFSRSIFENAGIEPNRITVIHPGIHAVEPTSQSRLVEVRRKFRIDNNPTLLFAGDYDFSQAARTTLEAAISLARTHRDLRVLFTVRLKTEASAHMEQRLKARVAREGLAGRFSFYNEVEDFLDLLEAVDICLLPAETTYAKTDFPYVLLESMARVTPVIVGDAGPLRELVAHGGGVAVPPQDPQALAMAIEDLLSHRDRLTALGLEARQAVEEHFSAEQMVRQYEELYARLAPRGADW